MKLLYFARLREALGTSAETLSLPTDVRDIAALRALLRQRGGAWADELAQGRAVRAAVNQQLVRDDASVADNDEVAFFPPVTGG